MNDKAVRLHSWFRVSMIASLLVLVLIVVPVAASLANTPWPRFGYDLNNSRQSPFVGAQSNSVKWQLGLDTVLGSCDSPVFGPDGTMYFGTGSSALLSKGTLWAIAQNGTTKWIYPNVGAIYGSPAIASDGTIYFGSYPSNTVTFGANLTALNPNGTLKWRYPSVGPIQSSPAIGPGGTIYFGSGLNFTALSPAGSPVWNYHESNASQSSLAIYEIPGNCIRWNDLLWIWLQYDRIKPGRIIGVAI